MPLHIDAAATESYPFSFETKALLDRRVAPQFDFTASAKHTLPGKAESTSQHADHLSRRSRMSSSTGDGAIGRNLTARNFANGGDDAGLHRHKAIHPTRISHSEATETSSHKAIP